MGSSCFAKQRVIPLLPLLAIEMKNILRYLKKPHNFNLHGKWQLLLCSNDTRHLIEATRRRFWLHARLIFGPFLLFPSPRMASLLANISLLFFAYSLRPI